MKPTQYSSKDPQFFDKTEFRMKTLVHNYIAKPFREWFEIIPAFSDIEKEKTYKLRHDVYCEELDYEPKSDSGLEIDKFDNHSISFIVQDRETKGMLGSIRVIKGPNLSFVNYLNSPIKISEKSVEFSRLVIKKEFRQRKGEDEISAGVSDYSFLDKRIDPLRASVGLGTRFPYLPFGLFFGAISWCIQENLEEIYFLAEPRMAQHLFRVGIRPTPVGNGIELHGLRCLYRLSVFDAIEDLKILYKPLYREINGQIMQSLLFPNK